MSRTGDSARSEERLQLTLERVDQTAALAQLLLEDAHFVLQPVNTHAHSESRGST